jgi:hypothetical protein
MDKSTLSLVFSIAALLVSAFVFFQMKEAKTPDEQNSTISRPLQLQAYERLVLLCERIALPNLISRVSQPGLSAREMQVFLLETIKQEFEYNASQQIYVSTLAWDAVRNLRDQNMLVINSIARALPKEATASELNRQVLESVLGEERAALHTHATGVLSNEAKKIM